MHLPRAAVCLLCLAAALACRPASAGEPKGAKDDKSLFKNLKYRLVGPFAGGRVSRACGVAGDPRVYYLGAASGGVWKTTDGGTTWKPIFDDQPTSSIGAVAVAPSDANVVYVGSGEANIRGNVAPGNGIYRSTDGGKSWKHVWKQEGQIGHIIVHPRNADIAFAAVLGRAFGPNPERGVYRTTDGGKTWKQVLTYKVLVKRETVKVPVYPPARYDPKGMRLPDPPGVEPKFTEEVREVWDHPAGAIDVCFDLTNPRIVFAALWQARRRPWELVSGGPGSGLYRSADGGDTWKQLGPAAKKDGADEDDNGLPPGPWGRVGVAVAPSDGRRVYALIEAEKGGLYRSDDGGKEWKLVNPSRYLRIRPWYFSTVHVDPKNPDVVYCPSLQLLKSIDGGATFKKMKGPHHVDHHDLWIDPRDPRRMIDANDGGVDITLNGGETWHAPRLPLGQFYHIGADNSTPYRVSGNMQDLGTASGPSNSLSSAGIQPGDWHPVGGGETGYAVHDPTDPNVVYAGEYGGYVSVYDHRTRQARNVSIYPTSISGRGAGELRYRFQWTAPLLLSPHDPKTLYHAANVLFQTTDRGRTWKAVSPDLTRDDKSKQKPSGGPITGDNVSTEYYCTIFALAESPKEQGLLWAGSDDGLVHVKRPGAANWANVTKGIPGIPEWGTVCCIEASPHDAGTAYVVVDNHRMDDLKPYLFKTDDRGKTWARLSDEMPRGAYLRVVREDPKAKGLLYAGTETGVIFSPDGGATWLPLKLNMPTVAASDLIVKGDDLVVGTNGRSIWILDDLTPVRALRDLAKRKGADAPEVLWLGGEIRPAVRWRYHGPVHSTADKAQGDNPPAGALLHYYLKKKAKEVTLEIRAAGGALVRKLSSGPKDEEDEESPEPALKAKREPLPVEPGLHRVVWDLHWEGAPLIPGAKVDWGSPHKGPLALPGTYTVRLKVDGKERPAGKLEILPDPRVKLPPEELAEQLKLALQVRDEIGRLVKSVARLRAVRSQVTGRIDLLKDDKKAAEWVKQAAALAAKLDALEGQLHNPKAEHSYDILAQKGGARLYSQLTALLEALREGDGPPTQGVREVYAEHLGELRRLEGALGELLGAELRRLNEASQRLGHGAVLAP